VHAPTAKAAAIQRTRKERRIEFSSATRRANRPRPPW